jgi:signal transduction histidine kinase/DNA-binding response OmpR family regulator
MTMLVQPIAFEDDVVFARQRARTIAGLLGFDAQDQTRIATAVSELARNAYAYAGGGRVEFDVAALPAASLEIAVADDGPGIADVDAILSGTYRSATGMGLGLVGVRRLMDGFALESKPGRGTRVVVRKYLSHVGQGGFDARAARARVAAALTQTRPQGPLDELREQNRELLRLLDELKRRQEDLTRLNEELEDTNRGVVALYAELDEKADHLRRADELKSRFLSNMTHEFRTPVNSILGLTRLLLDRFDGDLTTEQERQVTYIRKAAEDLSDLVNDLLDLAKVEAGKIVIRPAPFDIATLFGTLRGMLRPVLLNQAVDLVFEDPHGLPPMNTDEAKVSQILRNFISNALKYTERGEVRISARPTPDGRSVMFSVADTGMGIAPEDQVRIFEDFAQVEGPHQTRMKGTGLGLPLTRKLAHLLGGHVSVVSQVDVGSTFTATIPIEYAALAPEATAPPRPATVIDRTRLQLLVVEDREEEQLLYEKLLKGPRYQIRSARTVSEASTFVRRTRPDAIILDIELGGEDTWEFLAHLKSDPTTDDIPVLVVTQFGDSRRAQGIGADAFAAKPVERSWLLERLAALVPPKHVSRVLLIEDEEASRYLIKEMLEWLNCSVIEAADGATGVRLALERAPQLIVADLMLPDFDGLDVLTQLRANPDTRATPFVLSSARPLTGAEHTRLEQLGAAWVKKDVSARPSFLKALRQALTMPTLAPPEAGPEPRRR